MQLKSIHLIILILGIVIAPRSLLHAMPNVEHLNQYTFIVPENDGEARAIIYLLKNIYEGVAGAKLDLRISKQKWGATLDKEDSENLKNLRSKTIVVEMPSPLKESEIRQSGVAVVPIDHHNYPWMNLDRSNPQSSIEQISELLESEAVKSDWFLKGIAINDRSYIFGLLEAGFTASQIQTIRKYDLEAQGFTDGMFQESEKAFLNRQQDGNLTIVILPFSKTGYVADLFTLHNKGKIENILIVTESASMSPNGKAATKITELNFSGSPAIAHKLAEKFKGWSGGDKTKSMYWGISGEDLTEVLNGARALISDCHQDLHHLPK